MYSSTTNPTTYQSKGCTVSLSSSHEDLWVITNNTTNKFHTLRGDFKSISKLYPVE